MCVCVRAINCGYAAAAMNGATTAKKSDTQNNNNHLAIDPDFRIFIAAIPDTDDFINIYT